MESEPDTIVRLLVVRKAARQPICLANPAGGQSWKFWYTYVRHEASPQEPPHLDDKGQRLWVVRLVIFSSK